MLNNPVFGAIVKHARGDRSQLQLAEKADTFRQRFGQVENGQPHELSSTALSQLDVALDWPKGLAEAALQTTTEPGQDDTWDRTRTEDTDPRRLTEWEWNMTSGGGRVISTAPASTFRPFITAAARTTLIDVNALTTEHALFNQFAARWESMWQTPIGSGRAVRCCNCGLGGPVPIAVDPLPGITRLDQALTLVHRINDVRDRPRIDEPGGRSSMSAALSVLAAAFDLDAAGGVTGIDLINDSALYDSGEPINSSYPDLLKAAALHPARYPRAALEQIFTGLLDARDAMLDISFTPGSLELPRLSWTQDTTHVHTTAPKVVAARDLVNTLVFYDAKLSPELPTVVEHALASHANPPPIVITTQRTAPRHVTGLTIEIVTGATTADPADQWRISEELLQTPPPDTEDYYATLTYYNRDTKRAAYTARGRTTSIDLR